MKAGNSPKRRQTLQALALLATAAAIPTARAQDSGAWIAVTHKVESFERWKPIFESTASMKRGFGWKQSWVFAIDGDRNNVLVLEEFGSMERARAFASSPELKAAMGKAGVLGPPEIRFLNTAARANA